MCADCVCSVAGDCLFVMAMVDCLFVMAMVWFGVKNAIGRVS